MVYQTQGVCSKEIQIDVENGIIKNLNFVGGCNGNLKGIAELAKGRTVDEIIEKFSGLSCGNRPTSCPDQLARALKSL